MESNSYVKLSAVSPWFMISQKKKVQNEPICIMQVIGKSMIYIPGTFQKLT